MTPFERKKHMLSLALMKAAGKIPKFNPLEFFACVASRYIEDRTSVFVGTGIPLVGAKLAQRLHAKDMMAVYEGGGVDPLSGQMPWSVCCAWTYYKGAGLLDMVDVFGHTRAGYIDYGIVSGAQVDKYGNLNSHIAGAYEDPKVRFSGSGGANDMATLCERTIIVMRHEKQRFVERCDFITSPGYIDGPGARENLGLPGKGPKWVITSMCICDFDEQTKVMRVRSMHPTITPETIRKNTGFDIIIPNDYDITPLPTEEELRILREEVDPNGLFTTMP